MGVSVQIEADYCTEILNNVHPDGRFTGGNAVYALWSGLNSFCMWRDGVSSWMYDHEWFLQLEKFSIQPLSVACRAFVDCAWGDDGDGTNYQEDDYEFYKKRHPSTTEEEFLLNLKYAHESWQPIDEVIKGVQLLLSIFKSQPLEDVDGLYISEYAIPDFEALLANLEFLAKRRNNVVRLNFM